MCLKSPETGESGYKQVVQTFENETTELVTVTYEDEEIVATPPHPFYVPQKGWTEAINLRAGDILVSCNGEYVVVEQIQHEILETPVTVYNFEVEDYHTYYVGDTSVLVHNKCIVEEGAYRADVRVGGDRNHSVGHAHIYNSSKNIASISETGEILAGKLDGKARDFVIKNLPQIADGIRRWYYIGR